MIWAQIVLPLIAGLLVISCRNVQADESFSERGNNSTVVKPGNKTHFEAPPLIDNFLYRHFVCRDKPNGLRLPITGSCVDYYECQQGEAQRLTCKEGTHFSNLGLTCLDARLSKCKPEQMEAPVNCEGVCCTREDGLYPAKGSCSDFFICVNGQTFRRSCGGLLQFSADNLMCDIPERARCSEIIDKDIIDEEKDQSKQVLYMVSHRVCRNQPDGYSLPIYGSCNKFYLCVRGTGYLRSCGQLQFNPEKLYCDARTRMYCPENADNEIILDEEEYVPVDTWPMPVPRPKPSQIRPLPLIIDGEEDEDEVEAYWPHWSKRPVHSQSQKEYEVYPLYPPHRRPQHNKKPFPTKEENVQQNGKRPRPPVEEEEEEVAVNFPQWGKKPDHSQFKEEEAELSPPYPPHRRPQNGKKPAPSKEEEPQQNGKRPRPPVIEEEEEEEYFPQWGKKPAPRPPIPEDFEPKEDEEEHLVFKPNRRPWLNNKDPIEDLEEEPVRPNKRPQEGNKKPDPQPEKEVSVPVANVNICADQPVGALMAMPGDCTKYVRCRWDWFERRTAEVMTCPQDMHFNAKSKYCDWPENAGCLPNSKKATDVFKKKTKLINVF